MKGDERPLRELLRQWLEPCERLSQLALVAGSAADRSMADLGKLLFECVRHRASPLGDYVKADLTRARVGEQRDLLPLPVPWSFACVSAVMSQALDPTAGNRRRSARSSMRRQRGIGCWLLLCILSLDFLYRGMGEVTGLRVPSGAISEVQMDSLNRFLGACTYLADRRDSLGPPVTPCLDPFALLNKKRISYSGVEVCMLEPLTLAEILPGLPPVGSAASVDPLLVAEGEVLEGLRFPERFIKPEAEWDDFKPARVHANDDEWGRIGSTLLEPGVFVESDPDEIPRIRGAPVLCGAFGVEKSGTPVAPATRVLRLIINAIPTNGGQWPIHGDIQKMPTGGEWHHVAFQEGELPLWSSGDVKGCFHISKLPRAWQRWTALSKPIRASALIGPNRSSRVASSRRHPNGVAVGSKGSAALAPALLLLLPSKLGWPVRGGRA